MVKKRKRGLPAGKKGSGPDSASHDASRNREYVSRQSSPAIGFRERLEQLSPYGLWIEAGLLLIILAVGLLVRLEDLSDWRAQPDRALYHGEPLLTTFDGYFYLTLARDLAEGTYTPVDEKRAVPDNPKRPFPPPLISVIAAGAAKITPFSMNWIGAVLPALLGLLLAVPLYGLGRFYGGPVMGLSAALVGLLSHYYVYRSSLGWFDTDCMNVTWATGAAYCFLKFGVEKKRRRYLYFLGGLIAYGLFLWWWDSTPQIVTIVSLLPMAVALVFFYRPSREEGVLFFSLLGGGAIIVFSILGWDLPLRILDKALGIFSYIAKESAGDFPNTGLSISEQAVPGLSEIISKTTGSVPAFICAGAGMVWLFIRKPKASLFLSVPLAIGILSFFFAKRFMIFLAPMTALGIGYLISGIWEMRGKYIFSAFAAPVLLLFLVWPSFSKDMSKTFWPKEPPHLVAGMDLASRKTPPDAVIWAWWDHGYPMQYWARRGTITDGTFHGPQLVVYNGIPLATDDYRLAANFMQFYVARGKSGLGQVYKAHNNDRGAGLALAKKVLSAGPEKAGEILNTAGLRPQGELQTADDWLRFFFPSEHRPVYLFLDWRLTVTSYWWFWLGSWDVDAKDGIHPVYQPFFGVRLKGKTAYNNAGIKVDLSKGLAKVEKGMVPIRNAVINDGNQVKMLDFKREKGLNFELFAPSGFAALEDGHIANSVFNKLFLRHVGPGRYFRPTALETPSFQLWEVHGDTLQTVIE
ncbi:MAG TPA: hypothetical protein EYP57_01175 [Thermodesulfobacteriaceae bacterium]|nr:hypothetical protein [Thermodesulfobacteriaceae bacterium]